MKTVKVILVQKPLGTSLTKNEIRGMKEFAPHFVCFPEYFFVNRALGNHGQTPHNQRMQLKRMETLSREIDTVIIAGTMPESDGERLYNTSYVFDRGTLLGKYRKKNLFQPEVGIITPGNDYAVFMAYGITFGVLICADVFHDSAFLFMKEANARIIFSPTFSLIKTESVDDKYSRDNDIYVRGSKISGAVTVKVCGVRSDYKPYLQARSLIASSEKVLYRVTPDEEHSTMIIMKTISFDNGKAHIDPL